jgi:uncharacterized membrane protein (DUF106 family)
VTAARAINAAITRLVDLVVWPLRAAGPIWALLLVSLLAGVLMLWLFGKTSDQQRIRTIRDWIRGNMMAIRLYGDDLGLLFRLQGRILRATLTYMRLALLPMLAMLVPVLLLLIQLDLRFARRPLAPGESTTVKVALRDLSPRQAEVTIEAPPGVTVETEAVRVEARRELAWRVRADAPGRHTLVVRSGQERLEKDFVVGGGWDRISDKRTGEGFLDALLHPEEAPIAATSAVRAVEVDYAALPLRLLGFDVHWLAVFFVASIAFGFAFRRVLGVEI